MSSRFQVGTTTVDLVLHRAGDAELSGQEVAILRLMLDAAGEPVARLTFYQEVWGYRTLPRGRALDFAMARLRAKIEVGVPTGSVLCAVRGVGYRLVLPTATPAAPAAPATPADPVAPPTRTLAVVPDPFVGRQQELDEIAQRLDAGGLVSLIGPPGCGKTRLSIEAVHASQRPALQLRLPSETNASALCARLAALLDRPGDSTPAALAAALRLEAELCIVLDDAHTLEDDALEVVARWCAEVPGLRVLCTSWRPLGLPGEHLITVGPLSPGDAAALFSVRAEALTGSPVAPDVAQQLGARLDGLPLALELAASRTRVLEPDRLLQELQDRFRILREPRRTRIPRHRSMYAAIDAAWAALPPAHRADLAQVAVFRGTFALSDAEAILDDTGDWVGDRIEALVDSSLLMVGDGDTLRFRVLDSVRDFLLTLEDTQGAVAAAAERHARHFTRDGIPHPQELAEVRHVAHHATDPTLVAEAALRIARHHIDYGPMDVVTAAIQPALDHPDASIRGQAIQLRARVAWLEGERVRARRLAEEALELARASDSTRWLGHALTGVAEICLSLGAAAPAAAALEELGRIMGSDPQLQVHHAVLRGRAEARPEDGLARALPGLDWVGRTSPRFESRLRIQLTRDALLCGDVDLARRVVEPSRYHWGRTSTLHAHGFRARICARTGAADEAQRHLAEATEALRDLGAPRALRFEVDLAAAIVNGRSGGAGAAGGGLAGLLEAAEGWPERQRWLTRLQRDALL